MDDGSSLAPTVSPYSTGIDQSGDLAEFFPKVDPEFEPYGTRVLVQMRKVRNKTKSGIILSSDTKATEEWNVQVGLLISCGPLAFKRRDTAEPWPEGIWAKPGDFVCVPRWGGERRSLDGPDGEPVVIVLFNDTDLMGRYTGDPLKVKAYIA